MKSDITELEFTRRAIELALSQIEIIVCRHCGNPTRKGYCCGYCRSDDPSGVRGSDSVLIDFELKGENE